MKRRIFGLENEYGLTCTLNGQRRLSPDNVARYLFEKVIPGARNANVFLEIEARAVLEKDVRVPSAGDDLLEQVAGDVVRRQPALTVESAGQAVLVLEPEDPP